MNRNEDVSVPESALMQGDYEPGSEAPTVIPPGDGGVSPSLPRTRHRRPPLPRPQA